jgi:tRNA-dihydrouridine synthase A
MMDWTDRHCRAFHRVMTRGALLYTEMVTTGAALHGDRGRILGFDAGEHPVALQLGGSEPDQLAAAARMGEAEGYVEINLNVGCPSDRVQDGRFGACLMREPEHVGVLVAAMKAAVRVPVTVKCRIGVDDQDPGEALDRLADASLAAGADALIVHARKAWLQGLSPKENRDVPPLDYGRVHCLKARLPHLPIALNGGLLTLEQAEAARLGVAAAGEPGPPAEAGPPLDGVMLGRAAYHDPSILIGVDPLWFGQPAPVVDAFEAVEAYLPYVGARLAEGVRLHAMTRHMLGLFNGRPGARAWRRHLAVEGVKPGAGLATLREALALVRRDPIEDRAA